MSAAVAEDARPARRRLSPPAARILRMEIRHSAFVWSIPLLALLFIYDPFRTASGYPDLWTVRASVVLNKFWPDCVPFTAGFSAWAGSREGRRNVGDLLGTTARPAWARQVFSLLGTLAWVLAVFLAGVVVIYVRTAQVATWGGPPIWPVVAGVVALTAVSSVAFTLGALFPGRFTAPIVAVGITVLALVAFREGVNHGGTSFATLSPDGLVPPYDAGVFYPVPPDVSIVQVMFYAGVVLAAAGLLGLSPRAGGVGWRGALDAASAGGVRLRAIATTVCAVGVALAVTGSGLAGTARASATGEIEIPALHDSASGKPVPYTPVCAHVSASFQVCLHPAYRNYLSQAVNSMRPVMAELAGLPGAPVRAAEVAGLTLPAFVLQDNVGDGEVTGTPPVYKFGMNNALTLAPDAAQFQDGFRQDIVHAVIVGSTGQLAASVGTPAQQAVVNGLLKAAGSQPYPVCGPGNNPNANRCRQQQMPVMTAAGRFAALPAATRRAWLAANLAALKAGSVTLAQVP